MKSKPIRVLIVDDHQLMVEGLKSLLEDEEDIAFVAGANSMAETLNFLQNNEIDVIFIVDEAQNLTPHEVKTIITRAGENTKIIFTGDVFQIDTPYLDAQSNGLSYLIHNIKHHDLYAHIRLEKGERSELANLANELL